jgi:predicted RNase H-like nuclease (RuvC/YqgF family)
MGDDLPDAVLALLRATEDPARVRQIRDVFAGLGGPLAERVRRQRLESDTALLREGIRTRDQQIERFQSDTAVLQWSVQRLEAEVARLGKELVELPEHLDLIKRLQHETVRLGRRLETGARELANLRQQEESARSEAERLQATLGFATGQAERFQDELGLAQGRITAMESSKFWKLRTGWFRLKRAVGIASQE